MIVCRILSTLATALAPGFWIICALIVAWKPAHAEDFADPKRAFERGIWLLETESLKPYNFVGRVDINNGELVMQSLRREAEGYYVPAFGVGRWDLGWGVLLRAVVYTRPDGKSYLRNTQAIAGGKNVADALSRYYGESREGIEQTILGYSVTATEHLIWMSRKSVAPVQNVHSAAVEARKLRADSDKSRALPDRIYIAIRAFIPKKHPSRSEYIFEAPFKKGKYIFRGPTTVSDFFLERCYNSDDRDYDSGWSPNGKGLSSKIAIALEIKLTPIAISIGSKVFPASETIEYKCNTGEITCNVKSDTTRTIVETPVKTTGSAHVIKFSAASRNKCVPETILFGDIDIAGQVTVDTALRTIEVLAEADDFPAFEAYAGTSPASLEVLFKLPPATGATVIDLIAIKPSRGVISRIVRF